VPRSATALGIQGVEFLPLASSHGEPVELHAIWSRKVSNPALSRLLGALDFQLD